MAISSGAARVSSQRIDSVPRAMNHDMQRPEGEEALVNANRELIACMEK